MPLHEHFEELCALAITGTISEAESGELSQHLEICADCRRSVLEFHKVGLILACGAAAEGEIPLPEGITERFIARAHSEGIPLTSVPAKSTRVGKKPERRRSLFTPRSFALSGLAALVLFVIGFSLGDRYGYRRQKVSGRTGLPPMATESPETNSHSAIRDPELKEELLHATQQVIALSGRIKEQQMTLDSVRHERDQLAGSLADLTAKTAVQQDEQAQRSAEITAVKAELERLRTEERTQRAELLATQAELQNEKLRASDFESELNAAKQTNAALGEARDLITARNLHVIDVLPEVGEFSSPHHPFGRIFYTEGDRLDFYAYDLADPHKLVAKTFYLWQEIPGQKEKATKLGRFQLDNEKDARWVVRITDPRLLSEMKSVFVTLESDAKDVTRPTGKKILSTYVGNKANHP